MARQSISNRYIKLEDLRTLLTTKFGVGNFKIQVGTRHLFQGLDLTLTAHLGKG